jgi:hypothetical protein
MVDQMELFEAVPAPRAERPPESRLSLNQIAYNLIHRRDSAPKIQACRNCRCTEPNPCRQGNGDHCHINARTGYCSAYACQKAAARAA